MALSPRLELRQSQALVMTPQLMQAIKLLQMSNLDLVAYVEGELERNPLLERGEGDDTAGPGAEASPEEPQRRAGDDGPGDLVRATREGDMESLSASVDADYGNVFDDGGPGGDVQRAAGAGDAEGLGWSSVRGDRQGWQDGADLLESTLAGSETLHEALARQLAMAMPDPASRLIGLHLIDLIDERGYLSEDVAGIAERLGVAPQEVEAVLSVLQGFDPPGVGARDLAECLAIQLKELDRYDPAMAALVANLDLLARRELPALRRLCGVDEDDMAEMVAELRRLDPRPGRTFGAEPAQPVVPDVFVRPRADGGWHVELNSETLPRVLLDQTYYAGVARHARSDADKTYLSECLQQANWLVRSLDQRARTILKVSTEIVRQQDAFLTEGVRGLRPLNLRMVADAIQMHESTVSRVTANKFMSTPRGIFELKYFFTTAIAATSGGEAHSAESVRHRIREMIDGEVPDDILSDDTIVTRLRDEGVDIARRTVAKYRESLRIPSSVQRRREKRSAR